MNLHAVRYFANDIDNPKSLTIDYVSDRYAIDVTKKDVRMLLRVAWVVFQSDFRYLGVYGRPELGLTITMKALIRIRSQHVIIRINNFTGEYNYACIKYEL